MSIDPELETQYNARAAVPEHVDILEDWKRRSEALRARLPCRLDLAYAEGARCRVDLFTVEPAGAPLHVYLHGGYWQRGERREFHFVAEGLCAHGVNVALVGYDLCPAVPIDAIVDQARRALAWLWRNADALGFDAGRIQVCGHSAGGHLAAMLMATRWPEVDADLPDEPIQSGLAISGLYALEPLVRTSINEAVGMSAADARRASPALLPRSARAPLALAVGECESAEFHRQARLLAERWPGAGMLEVPGANHFTVVESLAAGGVLLERALALIGRA